MKVGFAKLVRLLVIALVASFAAAQPSHAVKPDEVLSDPVLEARARAISAELRCMVCQNQSIDDSDADLARDLRILVRERLVAGDTDDEVLAYVVSRYGEFVLLKPRFGARNAVLWGTPVLILAMGAAYIVVRGRRRVVRTASPLSSDEAKRLEALLDNQE